MLSSHTEAERKLLTLLTILNSVYFLIQKERNKVLLSTVHAVATRVLSLRIKLRKTKAGEYDEVQNNLGNATATNRSGAPARWRLAFFQRAQEMLQLQ